MLNRFTSTYQCTEYIKSNVFYDDTLGVKLDNDFHVVLTNLSGKTFNDGLYRVYTYDKISPITELVLELFPKLKGISVVFASDWLGRQFAVIPEEEKEKPQVVLLEPGTGDIFHIDEDIINFHEDILVDYANDALAIDFYNEWREANKQPIKFDECVGYKVPLFLGGNDIVENLEVINMEVYLEICAQLKAKTKTLKDGQKISEVAII